jgi:hypothetical protein
LASAGGTECTFLFLHPVSVSGCSDYLDRQLLGGHTLSPAAYWPGPSRDRWRQSPAASSLSIRFVTSNTTNTLNPAAANSQPPRFGDKKQMCTYGDKVTGAYLAI